MNHCLMHDSRDNVGVAVADIRPGQTVAVASLDHKVTTQVTALQEIPLGHKIALRDLNAGDTVIKYGEDIGRVVVPIRAGEHVHVHNLKTKRW